MGKYKELMSRIELTPQMKERILEQINQRDFHKKGRSWPRAVKYMGLATAACLVIVVGTAVYKNAGSDPGNSKPGVDTGIYTEQSFGSAKELASASGMNIRDIDNLPFEVKNTEYTLISNNISQISYYDASDSLISLRMTEGNEDNSGVYDEFQKEEVVEVSGVDVILKGDNASVTVAIWYVGDYSYSIYASPDVSQDDMINMITSLIQ